MEIELKNNVYVLEELPALEQSLLYKKLLPVIATFLQNIAMSDKKGQEEMASHLLEGASLFNALASLPHEDFKDIQNQFLSKIKRKTPGGTGLSLIMVDGVLLFPDIKGPQILKLIIESFKLNFAEVFQDLVPNSPEVLSLFTAK